MQDEPRFEIRVRTMIVDNDKILLVKERKPFEENWETPGGGLKSNETIEEALEREAKEELGMEIKIGKIVDAVMHTFPDGNKTIHLIYNAKILKKVSEPKKDIEGVKWFGKKEIELLIKEGKVDFHDKKVFENFIK